MDRTRRTSIIPGGGGGGANAAKADLARLKQRDESVDKKAIDKATQVFKAADAGISAVRTYETTHPAIERAISTWFTVLTEFINEFDELTVGLEGRALSFRGTHVFACSRVDDNPWFAFYGAGIRQFTFTRKVLAAELVSLSQIMNRFRARNEGVATEDDALTLLWELHLKGVQYIAVDAFLEDGMTSGIDDLQEQIEQMTKLGMMTELADAALTGQAYANGEVLRRMTAVTLSAQDRTFLRSENLSALGEVPDHNPRQDVDLMKIDKEQRAALVAGCERDEDRVRRYVEALVLSLEGVEGEKVTEELLELLCIQFSESVDKRDFALALRIIERVEKEAGFVPRLVKGRTPQILVASYAEFTDPERRSAVTGLLRRCASEADRLIELTAQVAKPEDRQNLLHIYKGFGEPTCIAAKRVLIDAKEDYALQLIEILSSMAMTQAWDALSATVKHPSVRVRVAAYRGLMAAKDPPTRVHAARRAIDDDSPIVRQLALDFLSEKKPGDARTWLREKIEHPDFKKLELPEKRRFYRAFAAVGRADDVKFLMDKLTQKNPRWAAQIDDERIAAAWALASIRHVAAEDELKKLSGKWFMARGKVRQAAKGALALVTAPADVGVGTMSGEHSTLVDSAAPTPEGADTMGDEAAPTMQKTNDGSMPLDSAVFNSGRVRRNSMAPVEERTGMTSANGGAGLPSGTYISVKPQGGTTRDGEQTRADTPPSGEYAISRGKRPTTRHTNAPTQTEAGTDLSGRTRKNSVDPASNVTFDQSTRTVQTGTGTALDPQTAQNTRTTADNTRTARTTTDPTRTARTTTDPTRTARTTTDPTRTARTTTEPTSTAPFQSPPKVKPVGGESDLRKAMQLARNLSGKKPDDPEVTKTVPPQPLPGEGEATRDALAMAKKAVRTPPPRPGKPGGEEQ